METLDLEGSHLVLTLSGVGLGAILTIIALWLKRK